MKQSRVIYSAVIVLTAFVGLTGCGLKQDPMDGRSSALRNADKPGTKPEKPQPIDSQNLVIDSPTAITFSEGQENKFNLKVRVLLPDYDRSSLTIENLNAFPGAQFDSATGEFRWKPDVGAAGADLTRVMSLTVRAFVDSTKKQNLGVLTRSQSVVVVVTKSPQDPIVSSIVGLPTELREHQFKSFHVKVRDVDGSGLSGKAPEILFLPPSSGSGSIASMITVGRTDYDSTAQMWDYVCDLSLDEEITDSSRIAGFDVKVVSGFGKSSQAIPYTATIYTSLRDATTTWPMKDLTPAVENHVSFAIYNPQGEGDLVFLPDTLDLPKGAKLSCDPGKVKSAINCEFVFTPVGAPGRITYEMLNFKVRTSNTDSNDSVTVLTSLRLIVRVGAL